MATATEVEYLQYQIHLCKQKLFSYDNMIAHIKEKTTHVADDDILKAVQLINFNGIALFESVPIESNSYYVMATGDGNILQKMDDNELTVYLDSMKNKFQEKLSLFQVELNKYDAINRKPSQKNSTVSKVGDYYEIIEPCVDLASTRCTSRVAHTQKHSVNSQGKIHDDFYSLSVNNQQSPSIYHKVVSDIKESSVGLKSEPLTTQNPNSNKPLSKFKKEMVSKNLRP